MKLNKYIPSIVKFFPAITTEIRLSDLVISKSNFQCILTSSNQCRSICFKYCLIDTSMATFSRRKNGCLPSLYFYECSSYSKNQNSLLNLRSLIESISGAWDELLSFSIVMGENALSEKEVSEMISKYQIANVRISGS
mmetsp:Transcript_2569/g.3024  ORF Transcript_2569/g.3024 Transcript_2569/m.3024 type:complete len:138 (+) Transcript_2569:126-539(+)